MPKLSIVAKALRRSLRRGLAAPSALFCTLLGALLFAGSLAAQSVSGGLLASQASASKSGFGPVKVDAVEVELVSSSRAARPGGELMVGLRIRHDPHWHTYWRNPGDSGLPTTLRWTLPTGVQAGEIQWPAPKRLPIGPLTNFGYEDELVLPVALRVPAGAAGLLRLQVQADWLMCKDVCIPGSAALALDVPVESGAGTASEPDRFAALFEAARAMTPARADQKLLATLGASPAPGVAVLQWRAPEAVQSAVFFPYKESWLANAGVQTLYRASGTQDNSNANTFSLQLPLSAETKPQTLAATALEPAAAQGQRDQPFGLMVVNGQPFEVQGRWVGEVTGAPGVVIATSHTAKDGAASPGLSSAAGSASSPTAAAQGGVALLVALGLAVLGGVVLNLMPCVFPVLGLKVLTFAAHGGAASQSGPASHAAGRRDALLFTAGVLVSFWVLAGILLALQSAGSAVGWGFQLQSPWFVAAMVVLFVVIALNLFGLFEFGSSATRLGAVEHSLAQGGHKGLAAFASGVLAVLVATPCTAPFMGSALGFTLGQPGAIVVAVFTALGLGLALPYLVLGWFPAALRWLPAPGRWMESLRQALGFPMLATALWLLWVLEKQAGEDAVLALSLLSLALAFLIWMMSRFLRSWRLGASLAIGAVLVVWLCLEFGEQIDAQAESPEQTSNSKDGWQAWSPQAVQSAQQDGRAVLVDFTAAWCVSCQVNKKLVLQTSAMQRAFDERGVVLLRADWTRRDAAITAELARHGRNGVPLYLLYSPGQNQARVLPEILTEAIVMNALAGITLKP
jgi:thiol:disulfide interchange protein